jgi:flagellar protein FliS
MPYASRASALRYYSSSRASEAREATPHRLVAMLYDGALERLGQACAALAAADLVAKVRAINSAMEIVSYLRSILNMEAGGDISRRLDALYDYALRRLAQGNASNDAEALREVVRLLGTIKSGWDAIAPAAQAA